MNEIVKYEICKAKSEVPCKGKDAYKVYHTGIAVEGNDVNSVIIASFASLKEAEEELKKYRCDYYTFSSPAGKYIDVTEYFIEKNTYDADDLDAGIMYGGDIWTFAELNEYKAEQAAESEFRDKFFEQYGVEYEEYKEEREGEEIEL